MKVLKPGLAERIKVRLLKMRSGRARKFFQVNIGFPSDQLESDSAKIHKFLEVYEAIIPDIVFLLKTYRANIPNVWDQTKNAAAYLLICKALSNFEAIIEMAKKGRNQELVELCRSAIESLDLVFLFTEQKSGSSLKKWFKGEIISNDEARDNLHKILNAEVIKSSSTNENGEIPLKDMKSDIYHTYSLYTHSAYSALLDSIDVYYEDYDFKKYAGFHFVCKNLSLIDNVAVNIALGLKDLFIRANDQMNTRKVDGLLKKIGYQDLNSEELSQLASLYK